MRGLDPDVADADWRRERSLREAPLANVCINALGEALWGAGALLDVGPRYALTMRYVALGSWPQHEISESDIEDITELLWLAEMEHERRTA